MGILPTATLVRVVVALGIVNLVMGLLIFFSCRCLPGSRIARNWMQSKRYQRFYRYHCYIWWVFWTSVIVHAVFAVSLFGLPL